MANERCSDGNAFAYRKSAGCRRDAPGVKLRFSSRRRFHFELSDQGFGCNGYGLTGIKDNGVMAGWVVEGYDRGVCFRTPNDLRSTIIPGRVRLSSIESVIAA